VLQKFRLLTRSGFQEKLQLSCVYNSAVAELMRCIRSQMESLITGLPSKELSAMSLGLAHRYVVHKQVNAYMQALLMITLAV